MAPLIGMLMASDGLPPQVRVLVQAAERGDARRLRFRAASRAHRRRRQRRSARRGRAAPRLEGVPVQRVSRPGRPGLEGRPRGAVTQGMKLRLRSRPTASAEGPSDAVTRVRHGRSQGLPATRSFSNSRCGY